MAYGIKEPISEYGFKTYYFHLILLFWHHTGSDLQNPKMEPGSTRMEKQNNTWTSLGMKAEKERSPEQLFGQDSVPWDS